ncbi:MAG: DUF3179 domain-containing protein [Planctomycetia bacterium]|nr:DUF3179 domain-containing protein [Planctomycetia bacterium]
MPKNHSIADAVPEAQSASEHFPSVPTTCAPRRIRVRLVVLTGLLMLVAWRTYSDREFWHAAWSQRSLRPVIAPDGSPGHTLAAFQEPTRPAFDLSQTTVPVAEIFAGGPPKDGIPALSNPTLVAAREATYLYNADRVIGVVVGSDARAYPLRILDYHEIVNDEVGKLPIAVTYCPLCDSCAVFDRRTELGKREFGVSGLLYNSNVLMYDRGGRPESLWSQVMTEGVSGPAARKSLKALPLELTTWKEWRTRNPETKVLSIETGHRRDYSRSPYTGYFDIPQLMFPAKPANDQLSAKARVLGVWTGTKARAYPESAFGLDRTWIEDTLDGKTIVLEFNPESNSLRVANADEGVQWMYSLWFAWYAMRPGTDVFRP